MYISTRKSCGHKLRTNTNALNREYTRSSFSLLGPRTELHVNETNTTRELNSNFVGALNDIGQVVFNTNSAEMLPVSVTLGCVETNKVPDLTVLV